MNLIKEYDIVCNKIAEEFATKQELVFEGWIGDHVGSVACFSQNYHVDFVDVILDLRRNVPKGEILNWINSVDENNWINYSSWFMGFTNKKKEDE